ncbi:MAG: cell envelope integrity protein CreD [Spirochaetaceae bacterium]
MIKEKKGLVKDPIVLKGLTMILITSLLLIPLGMIESVIKQRNSTRKVAENELIQSYGGGMVLSSPVLIIPYNVKIVDVDKKVRYLQRNAYFLPNELNITGDINPVIKKRGIYEFLVYNSNIEMAGTFSKPDFTNISDTIDSIFWDKAFVVYEVSNIKGYTSRPKLYIDNMEYNLEKGSYSNIVYSGGLSTPIKIGQRTESLSFRLLTSIQGGKSLGFIPLGSETNVNIKSKWDSPSFYGSNLPTEHNIVENQGFNANWYVNSFSRDFSKEMNEADMKSSNFKSSSFGLKLLFPVDLYLMAERCVKYGGLFLIIPFITFFLMEIFSKKRVHVFHYLFVGITSILFFLLLLSFGEHFSFYWSYIVGVTMVSALITYYACYFLKSIKQGLLLFPIMLVTYVFMFFMINSEDYALLMGSLGLFTIVGGIMVVTRKIDWYSFGKQDITTNKETL